MYTAIFPPEILAGIKSGIYELVKHRETGQLLTVVRDKATGKFIRVARIVISEGANLNPLIGSATMAVSVATSAAEMIQTHRGFQKTYRLLDAIQSSLGVLQTTTAVIGVGTFTGVALSAVNLHQTLKLREDVRQLRLEVHNGFIDLKQALSNQSAEVLKRIDQVADDTEFRLHRTLLAEAYGIYMEALRSLKDALRVSDLNLRTVKINNAEQMLRNASAAYNNPQLFSHSNVPGVLRRKECAWAIDQTITLTYQLLGQYDVVVHRLNELQARIRNDAASLTESCQSEEELQFLFPELTRICRHDLLAIESWQHHVDWVRSLPADEQKMLSHSEAALIEEPDGSEDDNSTIPPEMLLYGELKQKSHFESLRDQLKFNIKPELRHDSESYVAEQASKFNPALVPSNWQDLSDQTVANLYWYFKQNQSAST